MQEPMKASLQGLLFRPGQQQRVEMGILLEDFAAEHGDDAADELAHDIIEHFNSL